MNRWQRILAIIAFVAVSGVIAYFLFIVFFQPAAPPPTGPEAVAPGVGGLPTANVAVPGLPAANVAAPGVPGAAAPGAAAVAGGGLTLSKTLVATVAAYVALAKDGKSLHYYDQATGQFFAVDPTTGVASPLSDKTFPQVSNATWDPTGDNQVIMEFPDDRKLYFDFDKQEQVSIPSHWHEFEWAPKGDEVVTKSIGTAENNRFLVVANPDGSNARPIAPLGRNADKVDLAYSPTGEVVALSRTGSAQAFGQTEIVPIGKNSENFRSFVAEGLGVREVWSPDGNRILYSAASAATDWKPALWVVNGRGDAIGSERKFIGLQTWVDKCGFATQTVAYCAAPRELPTGAGFGRAVANDTPDDLYRVDLATGAYRLVASPSEPAAISKVVLSGDGSTLYYTELVSGALKQIRLR